MNAKNTLKSIINEFDIKKFDELFRNKNDTLDYPDEPIEYNEEETRFTEGKKLAEGKLDDGTLFIVCSFLVNKELTERSGKKAQYDLGKKILKEHQADGGIFIFYDQQGDFRFSLIYANYLGKHRDWSSFKRLTYFVSPKLTNKTFIDQIYESDFSTLEKIKEAFSVEPVTKQFYSEIQNWYFWAMDKIVFPKDYQYNINPAKDKEIRNATNLIRLITRIIFIWFLKEKDLIPAKLFLKDELKTIVKGFMEDNNSSNFYNAILQNLFFGTLNQKMNERKFAEDNGYPQNKKEYGIKNLYRYADKFLINKNDVLEMFKDTPFLNGGLFECLDKGDETGKVIYIDGFSRNKAKQAIIPDYLFFHENEEKVDLSQYGLGSGKPVRGIIEILSSYNFTIDENTPVDQEIALDPELLGKVFENLLASYNPETATTARKATGSYYTPREIVDYMVETSLSEYLKGAVSIPADVDSTASIFADGEALEGFLNPYNEIQIYEGNLPHWQQKNVFYFVTFRLADSIPREKFEQLRRERELWLKNHSLIKTTGSILADGDSTGSILADGDSTGSILADGDSTGSILADGDSTGSILADGETNKYTKEELKEYYRLFSERVEKWLNEGAGSCILKEEKFAKIVADTLLHFNGQRYILDEWVIMPNHVHILVKPLENYKLSDILHSWKSFTANEINKLLGIKGQLWMHESYDHIVRNEKAFEAIRNYIRQNPVEVGLKLPDCCCSWRISNQNIPALEINRSKDASATLEEKIKALLSYSDDAPEFSEQEKQKLISAIDEIKILDPTCGSGAFPMGILHKLVFALQKLDPENTYWYELQYQKALKSVASIFAGERPESKDALGTSKNQREERLKEINDAFDESINYPDYARKLYLIENCIYGVDIQPIAIQISKLRFFISLILDQKIDREKDNFGIRALPNLETRFVSANTLIGLEIPQQDLLFQNAEIKQIQDELAKERHKYFNAKTRNEKIYYQKQDKILREKLAEKVKKHLTDKNQDEVNQIKKSIKEEELKLQKVTQEPEDIEIIEQTTLFGEIKQIKIDKKKERIKRIKQNTKEYEKKLRIIQKQVEDDFVIKIAKKIADFDLYDQNASVDWFDPEWMFGIVAGTSSSSNGFDIVIANPPYIQLQKEGGKLAKMFEHQRYETFARMGDIYTLFYEKGLQLLKSEGNLCFITSNKWMRAGYGEKLRYFFIKYNPKILIDLGPNIFESATVDTNVLLIQKKQTNQRELKAITLQRLNNEPINIETQLKERGVTLSNLTKDAWFIGSNAEQKLKEKIERVGKPLKEWDVKIYRGVLTGLNEAFIIDSQKREEILASCNDEAERMRTEAIIKPILRGRDIKRYYYEWAVLWVIGTFPALRLNIEDYPSLKKYFLDHFDIRQLEQSGKKYPELGFDARKKTGNKWFETQDQIAYYPEFEKEKIIYPNMTKFLPFVYDVERYFTNQKCFIMTGKNLKYLTGMFNSKISHKWLKDNCPELQGGTRELSYIFFQNIPLPPITISNQSLIQQIEALVDKILTAKKDNPQSDTSEWEREIDRLVYELYELTEEEIALIKKEK